ncbi:hypothetical protein BIT28_11850 [Photobacterium proteolyticum]|uniref:Uncharacterized protein n=1 Tax=Photobacterium proteolyticum TaxID=1903952 RepID=A0A1Q9GF88_9GAMM|nr:hypothetical protein [Photobacterium proteolyticum]OLQ73057.1 hypothetical protein BIT28_11850 [Photobacterium proteolyticum]
MNSYTQITQKTLVALMELVKASNDKPLSEFKISMSEVSNNLIYIKVVAKSYLNYVRTINEYNQSDLEAIIKLAGGTDERLKEIESDFIELNGILKKCVKYEKDTKQFKADASKRIKQLKDKIKSKQKAIKKLKVSKWSLFFMPVVFGGISAAMASLKKQLSSYEQELDIIESKLSDDQVALKHSLKEHAECERKLDVISQELLNQKALLAKFEDRRKEFSRQIGFLSYIEQFCGMATNAIHELQQKQRQCLSDIESFLNEQVTVEIEEYIHEETHSILDGLYKFAEFLDRRNEIADHPRFIKVLGDDSGFYPFSYHLASKEDVAAYPVEAYKVVNRWEVVRLHRGLGLTGWGNRNKIEEYEPDTLTHTLCVYREEHDNIIVGHSGFVLMNTSTVTTYKVKSNELVAEVYNKQKATVSKLYSLTKKQITRILEDPYSRIKISTESRFKTCGTIYVGDRIGLLFLKSDYDNLEDLREAMIVVLLQASAYLYDAK